MKSHTIVWQEVKSVALGQILCCSVLVGVYALIGRFSPGVLLGAVAGGLLATLNFFVMALCADIAADRGQNQDIASGQKLVALSYLGRMTGLFVILVVCAKSGLFDLIALVLPLIFVRPILTVKELIRKKEGQPK